MEPKFVLKEHLKTYKRAELLCTFGLTILNILTGKVEFRFLLGTLKPVIHMSCLKCEFIPYGMCARCNVCGRVDK